MEDYSDAIRHYDISAVFLQEPGKGDTACLKFDIDVRAHHASVTPFVWILVTSGSGTDRQFLLSKMEWMAVGIDGRQKDYSNSGVP